MSLTKNQLKLITSLRQKKYRLKHQIFIAEGIKVVDEYLKSDFEVNQLFTTEPARYPSFHNVVEISDAELSKISALKSPNKVLALVTIPSPARIKTNGLIVALDGINDPGNLGTIIRLCDWFGVDQLVCSKDTVDMYNSKVVQASMGSLIRTSVVYTDLKAYLEASEQPKYATLMEGENVYTTKLPNEAVLVLGNEANGISKEILELLNEHISIPRFGVLQVTESLNVATAAAILLSEFRRT